MANAQRQIMIDDFGRLSLAVTVDGLHYTTLISSIIARNNLDIKQFAFCVLGQPFAVSKEDYIPFKKGEPDDKS